MPIKQQLKNLGIAVLLSLIIMTLAGFILYQLELWRPGVAAVVNGEEIEIEELNKRIALSKFLLGNAEVNDYRRDVLNQMINERLLLQKAAELGVKPRDATVEARTEELIRWLMQNRHDGDETRFMQSLEANGLTRKDIKEHVNDRVIIEKLITTVAKDVTISDQEVKSFYEAHQELFRQPEQVRVRMIMVTDADLALQIRERVLDGAHFGVQAKLYSEDPSSDFGGDLGYFYRGQLPIPRDIEQQAFTLDIGDISDVIESAGNFYIIKVEGKKESWIPSFESVKEEARQFALREKQKAAFDEYFEELKVNAKVKTFQLN